MDWSRVKYLLIGILLLLNVVLYVNIRDQVIKESPKSYYQEVINLLEDRGIDTSNLRYTQYEEGLKKFYVGPTAAYPDLREVFMEKGYQVEMRQGNLLLYTDSFAYDQLLSLEEFMTQITPYASLEVANELPQEDNTILVYNQSYDQFVFEDGYIILTLISDQVVRAEIKLLSIEEQATYYEEEVFSMADALLGLLDEEALYEEETKTIISFTIGYKLNDEDNLQLEEVSSGEPSPFWRAQLADGRVLHINGLR